MQLGFITDPSVTTATFGDLTLEYSGDAISLVLPEPIQRNVAAHNLVDLQKLYENAVLRVKEFNSLGRFVLELADPGTLHSIQNLNLLASSGNAHASCVIKLPQFDSNRSHVNEYIEVIADDGTGNLELAFRNTPKIIDDVNFAQASPINTLLTTLTNLCPYSLFLPSHSTTALATNSMLKQTLRVSVQSSAEIELNYEDGGHVYDSQHLRSAQLVIPANYAALSSSPYTLTLPQFSSVSGAGNALKGHVLVVNNSTQTSVDLSLEPVSFFTQIQQISLSSNEGFLTTTLKAGESANNLGVLRMQIQLPTNEPLYGETLAIKTITTPGSDIAYELEFTDPMRLVSNTGKRSGFIADSNQLVSYDIVMPSTYNALAGKTMLITSISNGTPTFEFQHPFRVEITEASASQLNSKYTSFSIPASEQFSYTLFLPTVATELGKILAIGTQTLNTELPTDFLTAGFTVNKTAVAPVVIGAHAVFEAPVALSQTYSMQLPHFGTTVPTTSQVLVSTYDAVSSTHTLAFSDLTVSTIRDQANVYNALLKLMVTNKENNCDFLLQEPQNGQKLRGASVLPATGTPMAVRLCEANARTGCTYTATGVGRNDTLSGPVLSGTTLTIDGQVAVAGDVVLINGQRSQVQNGIYTVTSVGSTTIDFVLTRHTSFDKHNLVRAGFLVSITEGTAFAGKYLVCNIEQYPRVGQGLIGNEQNTVFGDANCKFLTNSEPVVDQYILCSNQEMVVSAVVSDTELTLYDIPALIFIDREFYLGFLTGTDPITFVQYDWEQESQSRLNIGFDTGSPRRVDVGTSLTLRNDSRLSSEVTQTVQIPDFDAQSVGKVLSVTESTVGFEKTVTLNPEALSDMLAVAGTVTLVALPGSGSNTKQQSITDTTGAPYGIAWDGLTANTSSTACFSLNNVTYGTLVSTSEYVFECKRSSLYLVTISLALSTVSQNLPIAHGRGVIHLAMKKTDGSHLNSATEESVSIEDTFVLLNGATGQSQIVHSFVSDINLADTVRFELSHVHTNPANTNGVISVNHASVTFENVS